MQPLSMCAFVTEQVWILTSFCFSFCCRGKKCHCCYVPLGLMLMMCKRNLATTQIEKKRNIQFAKKCALYLLLPPLSFSHIFSLFYSHSLYFSLFLTRHTLTHTHTLTLTHRQSDRQTHTLTHTFSLVTCIQSIAAIQIFLKNCWWTPSSGREEVNKVWFYNVNIISHFMQSYIKDPGNILFEFFAINLNLQNYGIYICKNQF